MNQNSYSTREIIELVLNLGGNKPQSVPQLVESVTSNPEIFDAWSSERKVDPAKVKKMIDTAVRTNRFVKDLDASGAVVWSLLPEFAETDSAEAIVEGDDEPEAPAEIDAPEPVVAVETAPEPVAEASKPEGASIAERIKELAAEVDAELADNLQPFSEDAVADFAIHRVSSVKAVKVAAGQVIIVGARGGETETGIDGSGLDEEDIQILSENVAALAEGKNADASDYDEWN